LVITATTTVAAYWWHYHLPPPPLPPPPPPPLPMQAFTDSVEHFDFVVCVCFLMLSLFERPFFDEVRLVVLHALLLLVQLFLRNLPLA
jgi:hypothetical protein